MQTALERLSFRPKRRRSQAQRRNLLSAAPFRPPRPTLFRLLTLVIPTEAQAKPSAAEEPLAALLDRTEEMFSLARARKRDESRPTLARSLRRVGFNERRQHGIACHHDRSAAKPKRSQISFM
jgi:hypothetical protein